MKNMQPLKFKPEKKIRNAVMFSGMCFFVAAALILISVVVSNYKSLYQISCVVVATIGIQITSRFVLSDYLYILDNTDFIVVKTTGKKSTEVCNVTLKATKALYKDVPFKTVEKEQGKMNMRLNFCQNMRSDNVCMYVFDFNGKKTTISFEYNDTFFKAFEHRIDLCKNL